MKIKSIFFTAVLLTLSLLTGCMTNSDNSAGGGKDSTSLPNPTFSALVSYGTGPQGQNEYHYLNGQSGTDALYGSATNYLTSDGLLPHKVWFEKYFDTISVGDIYYGKAFGRLRVTVHIEGSYVPGNGTVTPPMKQLLSGSPLMGSPVTSSEFITDPRYSVSISGWAQYTGPGQGGFSTNASVGINTGGKVTFSYTNDYQVTLAVDQITGAATPGWRIDLYTEILLTGIPSTYQTGKG